jgi:hypothetical protein
MKLLAILLAASLVGCVTNPGRAMPYDQFSKIKLTGSDCEHIDDRINFAEQQLRLRGLTNVNPEDLNEEDRLYNSTARIQIWSLRIACNNPDRYKR